MGRRELTEKTSWEDSYSATAYTEDALKLEEEGGRKELTALRKKVTSLLADWDALDQERRTHKRTIGYAHALVRRRDVQADQFITQLHNEVLMLCKLDRKAPLFTRLFPDPLSSVVRLALESELPVLRELTLKLAEPETPESLRKAYAKPLTNVLEQGQQAIHAREEAFAMAGRTSARIVSWKEKANTVFLGIEGALTQIAAEQKLGPSWVDAFFPMVERKKSKEKSESNAPTDPVT